MSFFTIFTSFSALIYLYAGFRFIPSVVPRRFRLTAWLLLAVLLICLVLHFYFRITFVYPQTSRVLAWVGYLGLGFVSYLVCAALIRDAVFLISLSVLKVRRLIFKKKPLLIENPTRRRFLFQASGMTLAALSGSATIAGAAIALKKPEIVRIDIPLKPEHSHLRGLTIAQFTDLHVGPTVGRTYVEQVCEQLHHLQADLIVFTGDMADGSPEHLKEDVAPMKALTARLGKYFITGNHEYYSGALGWIDMAARLGFEPLINEHRVIPYNTGGLTLAGVTDLRGGTFYKSHTSSPQKALQGSPQDNYTILLAHQPPSIYDTANLSVDLQLSGHTHGGQYFPFGYFVYTEHPFVKGMHQFNGTQLYVSQGTGYWGPPLRLGTFPEITHFTFR